MFERKTAPPVRSVVFEQRAGRAAPRTSWMAPARPPRRVSLAPMPPPEEPAASVEPHDAPAPEPMLAIETPTPEPWRPESVFPERAVADLVRALEASIDELGRARARALAASERQLVELAGAIAKRVLGRAVALDPTLLVDLATAGIETLAASDQLTVRLGVPLDESTLSLLFSRLRGRAGACEVVHDPVLEPGRCVVETQLGSVDESLEARLDNVMTYLLAPEHALPEEPR